MKIVLRGDIIGTLIGADLTGSIGAFRAERSYRLSRVSLLRVGCPREIAASRENLTVRPLVVMRNRQKLGYVKATDYYPDSIVVVGGERRAGLLARGQVQSWGWVDAGLSIQADDAISCGELMQKLQTLLLRKFYGDRAQPMMGQPWPNILETYPFENYMVFEFGGQKYRQPFLLDPMGRDVALSGQPVKVEEKFVDACGNDAGMPRVQTGMRQTSNPLPLPSTAVVSRGGLNSDLVRMVIRDFANVNAAVANLVSMIRNGLYKPMKPDFAPVNLSDDGHIAAPLAAAGIATSDFMVWADVHAREFSDKQRRKLAKQKIALPDGSFPIANKEDLANARMAIGRAKNPAAARAHIRKRAKALDVKLPSRWNQGKKKEIDSFGKFHSPRMRDVGAPKKQAFHV